jgi:hypothetical protein
MLSVRIVARTEPLCDQLRILPPLLPKKKGLAAMRVLSFLPETAGMYIKLYIATNPQQRRPYHQHEKDSPSPFWSLSVKEGYRDGESCSAPGSTTYDIQFYLSGKPRPVVTLPDFHKSVFGILNE